MSAEAAALTRSWLVGDFVATMTVPQVKAGAVAAVCVEWTPHVPKSLTPEQLAQYREGRNAAVAALGLHAVFLEV